ncbi:hypothetical protein EPO14_01310 [Patescibacteria group bacterium]|nr:MAG: hypothetical protein EPO14_01310 [Patescibacteria group bacterium]
MKNKNALKIVAVIFITLDLVLLFVSKFDSATAGLFGSIIGWGIAIALLQKLFQWILNKRNVDQSATVGLIMASVFYAIVFSFFTFIA